MTNAENPPDPPRPEPSTPAAGIGPKRAMWAALGLVLAVTSAWGIGRLQGKRDADAAAQLTEQQITARQRATGEFEAQRDRSLRLEARRRLHLAAVAVDERNFGIAQSHLQKCATLLGRAKGIGQLDELAAEIAKTKLVASDDLGEVRQRLARWTQTFDQAMPPAEP